MENNEYKCGMCKKIYKKLITDNEAEKQLEKEFPGHTHQEDDEIVCDDCFKEMFPHIPVT